MAVKVVGSLNLGFTLIAFNYVLSWALALVYERIADKSSTRLRQSSRRRPEVMT